MLDKRLNIGVFGGTFNPIHNGHLRAADEAKRRLHLDIVIFVPSHVPPHKELENDTSADHRLEMTRLAIGDRAGFEVSDLEVRRGGNSYTRDTMRELHQTYPNAKFTFLLGIDAYKDIATWYDVESVLPMADWAVLLRPGYEREELDKPLGRLAELYDVMADGSLWHEESGTRIYYLEIESIDVSSTQIRARLETHEPTDDLVPSAVGDYIRKTGLYES
ncbi:MAG: nicotinate-nucleotide adenylyltransferase [Deltaproteobacteria bacterium]|nr:nicotinate-nucleotide adenylyltransferase [Deltaproteobacteria bacterium]MCB9487413.1 nicotinate-nucleotide adenylyltransferase [Deltaproteobacteria bacterium]